MMRPSTTSRVVGLLVLACSSAAHGQIRGDLADTGADNTGLWIELLVISLQHGELSEVRQRGGSILGKASVVVFPKEPRFSDILVRSWSADLEPVVESFGFEQAHVDVDVSLMDYQAYLVEPCQGTVSGWIRIDSATYQVKTTVRVVSAQLGLDVTLTSDAMIEESFTGEIAMAVGDLFLGRTPPPTVSLQAHPDELPEGITAVVVEVSMDAGNTSYRGPATPVLVGDSDLDDDVDLVDYAFGAMCVTDMTDLRCRLQDFDGDGVLTLIDFAGIQRAFTGDRSDP